ncbi:immune inhibitor A domain-containing protein [Muribaculum sp.]|jgi:M6 family metalloprotease-like protein|uniref:immune inhibitor A domain-containing protein n=1 Tax=Muribaculum sp. TaxID=1918611 RepID=UPI00257F5686|nr:immune inhibitor A domain-containing protein [Muribaculum sp.]
MTRFLALVVGFTLSLSTLAASRLANVVCFVRFSDQEAGDWLYDDAFYEDFFNNASDGANSVLSYYRDMSYGALLWKSTIVTQEYVDAYKRGYYRQKSEINPDGYSSISEGTTRFQTLVAAAARHVEALLPPDAVVDERGNGVVDNFTLVIQGNSESSSSKILWPHNSEMTYVAGTLAGKKLKHYLAIFDRANGFKNLKVIPLNTGVVCHELMHTLDAPDLYSSGKLNPVGIWDLMSDNQTVPQGFLAYIRQSYGRGYGNWIPSIAQLSEPGEYVLNALSSATPDNVAYMIKPDRFSTEYFLLEYRTKSCRWDASLPGSGILVTRLNPDRNGNGPRFFEVYVFRPGGSTEEAGNIDKAAISPDGRSTFGYSSDTDFYPFYSDGKSADFAITALECDNDKIRFRLDFELSGIDNIVSDQGGEPYFDGSAVIAPGAREIRLYNIQGQEILPAAIPSGLFVARITYNDGRVVAAKFVKY